MADPRNPIFDRTDMVFGTEIYASQTTGGIMTTNATAHANAVAAKFRLIRFQSYYLPSSLGGPGNLNDYVTGLKTILGVGAVPLMGLPPIDNSNASTQSQWFAWWKAVVAIACPVLAAAGVPALFEIGNEPNNYFKWTAQQYFSTVWTGTGGKGAPGLKAYARSLGYTIYVGGPAITNFSNPSGLITSWHEPFLTLCQNEFNSNGNHDVIPDYETMHCYGGYNGIAAQMTTLRNNFDTLRTWVNANMTGPVPGSTGKIIKFINSEYNIGLQSQISGIWNNQTTMNQYYQAIFQMAQSLSADGVQQRCWAMNQFCFEPAGTGLLLVNSNGTAAVPYNAFTSNVWGSTSQPVQGGVSTGITLTPSATGNIGNAGSVSTGITLTPSASGSPVRPGVLTALMAPFP